MNNYEYIIASLPVLNRDSRTAEGFSASSTIEEIRSQLDAGDCARLDFLLDGFDSDKLNEAFYTKALKSSSSFIRGYFGYDLTVRNTRVQWLNSELGRPAGQDMLDMGRDEDSEENSAILAVLTGKDILERERGLDSLMWDRIESLNEMKVFDLDVILGFVAKLKIVERWLKLDPQTGRELFRKMVEEIRANR